MFQAANVPNRLEEATEQGIYDYWLTQEDIADIARLEYQNYGQTRGVDLFKAFEIVGSPSQLRNQVRAFITRAGQVNNERLTLIINLEQFHWVTLVVVTYQNKSFGSYYYIDSLGQELPPNYLESLKGLQLTYINLSGYFQRQRDSYNCGLWALENAADLTRMADEQKEFYWLMQQLQRPRNAGYFSERRRLLSSKLRLDSVRIGRPRLSEQVILDEGTDNRVSVPMPAHIIEVSDEPKQKKQKLSAAEEVNEKLELFVQKFMYAFSQRLGAYYIIAKGECLTGQALKNELKTGAVGALLGITIAQTIVGSIPSLVASLRTISSKYYSKGKGQRITRAFSDVQPGDLTAFLTEAAVEIFQSYEQQFMQVTDKAGDKIAIEKLAEDASGRVLDYIDKELTPSMTISSELMATGVLLGKSEKYFDPSLKKVRLRITGSSIQDAEGHSFSTASFYEKVGLVIKGQNTNPDTFYKLKDVRDSTRYGYRRSLSWEKDATGQLQASYQSNYIQENPVNPIAYEYKLNPSKIQETTRQIIQKIRDAINLLPAIKQSASSINILFNLRKPLKNFFGRSQALSTLHQLLSAETKSAVITHQMAQLSFSSMDNRPQLLQANNQAAISGLGGIGKTQLALQYAKLYAADYDNNIVWIDSEKRIDILNCFKKLAIKLGVTLTDALGNEKENDLLVKDVYAFFSHVKSLFILDNVENYREIENILPAVSIANQPTILITSRYSNWRNIAPTLSLDVFTQAEAVNFIKDELDITHERENHQIKELTGLLQGLPLALQQAVAYIKNEKNIDSHFSIQSYIDCYKQKGQELLNFNFFRYNNDPYSASLFTTWGITLDKIKKEKVIGRKAIKILQMMAYLYPDNINNEIFLRLPGSERLSTAIQLLKSYSMINEGSAPHISTIHRVVQKVLRITLEINSSEFEKIVQGILYLTKNFIKNREILSHYLNFLLHMTRHTKLTKSLNLQSTHRKILQVLSYYEEDESLFFNIFNDARTNLPRKKYLDFIGEALVVYSRSAFIPSLINTIDYIEKKVSQGLISIEEAELILDFKYTITQGEYKKTRFSSVPTIKARQFQATQLIFELEHRMLLKKIVIHLSITTKKKKHNPSLLFSR